MAGERRRRDGGPGPEHAACGSLPTGRGVGDRRFHHGRRGAVAGLRPQHAEAPDRATPRRLRVGASGGVGAGVLDLRGAAPRGPRAPVPGPHAARRSEHGHLPAHPLARLHGVHVARGRTPRRTRHRLGVVEHRDGGRPGRDQHRPDRCADGGRSRDPHQARAAGGRLRAWPDGHLHGPGRRASRGVDACQPLAGRARVGEPVSLRRRAGDGAGRCGAGSRASWRRCPLRCRSSAPPSTPIAA